MLKVVVDATPIRANPSGVGLCVFNLIRSLYALQEQENFQLGIAYQPSLKKWLLGNFHLPEILQNYSPIHRLPIPVTISNWLAKYPNPILHHFEKCFERPDIVHGTDHVVYPCQDSLKAMTIHDIAFIKYPDYTTSIVRTYLSRVKQCLKWTDLVITHSENTKNDIADYLNVAPKNIYVTPLASRYSPNYLTDELSSQLQRSTQYDFSNPYLLLVSTIEPRKNITSLIEAFNVLKQKYKIEHNLVLIGRKGWHYEPIFASIEASPWRNQIYYLDYLSDECVALFYSKADVFVYPSHYEGFGLPILEAMTLGTPVITSNTSSLPEVAGDAALLIDPNDPIQLAETILKVISNSQLRRELIQKGKERAKLFSWEKTARETLKAYQSLVT